MDEQQIQTIIDSLFEMAWSDGEVSNIEKSTINRILRNLGLNLSTIMEEMNRRLEQPPGKIDLAAANLDRKTLLETVKFLIALCFCDDRLDPRELDIIERLALKLKISADELDALRIQAQHFLDPSSAPAPGTASEPTNSPSHRSISL